MTVLGIYSDNFSWSPCLVELQECVVVAKLLGRFRLQVVEVVVEPSGVGEIGRVVTEVAIQQVIKDLSLNGTQ